MPPTTARSDESDAQAVAVNTNVEDESDSDGLPLRVLLSRPTLPTGEMDATVQLHPGNLGGRRVSFHDVEVENSSTSGNGSGNDEFSNAREGHSDGTISPSSSRGESPFGTARKREEDLAGLAPKQGNTFESGDRQTTVENGGEDDEADHLKDIDPETHKRTLQPEAAEILGIRVPVLDDVKDTGAEYHPPPSEADVTDRGDRAFNAQKGQRLCPPSPIEASELDTEGLETQLDQAINYRSNHQTGFMPRGKLEKLVNVKAVERVLMKLDSIPKGRSTHSWAEIICGEPSSVRATPSIDSEEDNGTISGTRKYRKIFALLVQMGMVASIFDFIYEMVSDEDLPLRPYTSRVDMSTSTLQLCRKNDTVNPIACFLKWKQYPIRNFLRDQWAMVSPFFAKGEHRNVCHYQLEEEDVLPFTYDSRDGFSKGASGPGILERGGFGEVFKVCIHRDHHSFEGKGSRSRGERPFAVKKLYSTNVADWKSEIEILKRFTANPNPHLISLLATYEQSNSVHLIFHWADADLQKYWQVENKSPKIDRTTVRWVAKQCLGIASGIVEIHKHLTTSQTQSGKTQQSNDGEKRRSDNIYGRHGDIKPRNILWFKDGPDPGEMGTLVITDFGIAEMNSKNSRSGKSNRNIKFSPTYCPPETHVHGGAISQSYDIWTLGCLYLEFLTWLMGGWKLVQEFARLRQTAEKASSSTEAKLDRFFELDIGDDGLATGARVKKEVTDFITRLRSDQQCTEFISDFLELISNELLIVETREPHHVRCNSRQLFCKLGRMAKKMEESDSYGLTPYHPISTKDEAECEAKTSPFSEAATSTVCPPFLSTRATF